MKTEFRAKDGVVTFQDKKEIERKHVRGLLRKRARQYDSDSGESDTEAPRPKRKVLQSSFQSAFKQIMDKKSGAFAEDKKKESKEVILSKYRKPSAIAEAEKKKEEEDRLRKQKKE